MKVSGVLMILGGIALGFYVELYLFLPKPKNSRSNSI